jgi:hypothetical protein
MATVSIEMPAFFLDDTFTLSPPGGTQGWKTPEIGVNGVEAGEREGGQKPPEHALGTPPTLSHVG